MEKKRGRPRVDTESVHMRLPRELISAIDDRRRHEEDLPTRPEMIRRLLSDSLGLSGETDEKDETDA